MLSPSTHTVVAGALAVHCNGRGCPAWLVERLPVDAWFEKLAVHILVWVGVPTTAGAQLWPLDAWAERRAVVTGDVSGSNARTVQREVDLVLAEMRRRPRWYADYVERPLGMKNPPLAAAPVEHGSVDEPPALALTEPGEAIDARLADLASIALIAIEKQLADDPADEAALGHIIVTVFGRMDTSSDFMQCRMPSATTESERSLTILKN